MRNNNADETIQYGYFKDVIGHHCLMHEIENNFVYTPECFNQKGQCSNIGHLVVDRYYKHNCT